MLGSLWKSPKRNKQSDLMIKKIRVLLVDDHVLVRAGIRSLLEKMDFVEVAGEADNGRMAMEMIRANPPDITLMDIAMKELNGLEAAGRIAKEFPQVRVIILSMLAKEDFVAQALRSGAKGYLLKDAATNELETALKTVMSNGTYFSETISKMLASRNISLDSAAQSPLDHLTPRQREILQLIAEGKSTKEIAFMLKVSAKTVETHRALLMDRLDIHDVPGLVRYAIRIGLAEP
ncbi:MAG: DNA-binding response regulator [Verrucomicrobiales bacterium]|nr:DNA-binding response regulator [Verrucomicrobiales bacterium]